MKYEQLVQQATSVALERIQQEYRNLVRSGVSFSMQELLDSPAVNLSDYCRGFSPHPQLNELKRIAKEFGEYFGILLPNAEEYLTCAMFLFPTAPLSRIIPMAKTYAIDFYLNDKMGREVVRHLTPAEQLQADQIKQRIADLTEDLAIRGDAAPVEIANLEVLQEIAHSSPKSWFDEFLKLYCHHINIAHKHYSFSTLDHIIPVNEYIEERCHISGMPHTISLLEYSTGLFLDWDELDKIGIASDLRRLEWITSLIGCLMNDLFSFEKEVVDNSCDSNLVLIMVLNNPKLSLKEALMQASGIIRSLLEEFVRLMELVRIQADLAGINDLTLYENLDAYLCGLTNCVQASWMWQTRTRRYKRPVSVWKETTLPDGVMVGGV